MRSLLAFLVAVIAAVSVPASALAAPDQATPDGSIGVRLLDAPVALKDDPRALRYIVDNLPPGTTVTRHVMVSNDTGAPAQIDVYAGAARVADGTFALGEPGETNALSSWISVDRPTVDLADGEQAEVAVTIAVPQDAPEVEQYAVIWASHKAPASNGIINESRVGVRVYLSVGPGNGPPADFTISSLTPRRTADGLASVVASVTNTGGRAVDLAGTLNLSGGPGGLSAGPIDSAVATIAPGEDGEVVIAVPDSVALPAGPWKADVELESGIIKHDTSATLTFPDKGDGESVGSSDSTSWPLIAGIVVAVLALAGIGGYLVVRKRRPSGSEQ
ncbi:LPXTG cell wall anchor domain-containing protein [Rhodococcus hoagii]|uniref:LPXTG cell wall anchor domain-containing protein n=1 Tax=Rhodococcus hoagii TaxID=43767 RepID=UPI0007CD61EA|nr:LPXTG cell wall anchor domain-containing protein [Prescottella equi]MBM4534589.1 LPXTG cell wall anchor domain-containing protein [Prescottella equi]MBM4687358.1 LPXTG cell wall anchor domain-containing protein [Prescottella equi]NKR84998.1 LPXTG cell wall anchor domain-containing protein [Prescottella equi]ORJ97154.1 hypothetical protein A6F56_13995 [Prescottella equi]ORL07213.1 hypothetical protein A6I84_13140 [Prescottella equi]